jgi:hypothetical protein
MAPDWLSHVSMQVKEKPAQLPELACNMLKALMLIN